MTKAVFLLLGEVIVSFELSGHSGCGEEGSDIVCSAVSSAVYMTVNTISEIMKIPVEADVDDGYLKASMSVADAVKAHALTDGLYLHLTALREQYPDYLEIERGVFNA